MPSGAARSAFPYHEPDITTILTLSTFLLALNVVNYVLDRLLYCGLLGQIFLGVLWGTPGAKWLTEEVEQVIVDLGYLGLILLVYEGGLSTSFKSLKANLYLSVGVALTGIVLPIALSYVLQSLAGATPLQAFAAGAALCSTSLGTTFTVLGTTGLITTRMGVVLTSAAMMDDVVGLVMVQVISNLGPSSSSMFNSTTVIRPVFVSLAFALVIPLVAIFIIAPLTRRIRSICSSASYDRLNSVLAHPRLVLVVHTSILLGFVTGSSYAGTSNLFAAYLAGASVSWWDCEVAHEGSDKDSTPANQEESTSGEAIFARFLRIGLEKFLKPLFFASIGFSIPITRMFNGSIIWKGIVYALLMAFGKLPCGVWLIRISLPSLLLKSKQQAKSANSVNNTISPVDRGCEGDLTHQRLSVTQVVNPQDAGAMAPVDRESTQAPNHLRQLNVQNSSLVEAQPNTSNSSKPLARKTSKDHPHNVQSVSKPVSLYPAAIVACAMVARGEIGFLISAVADSNGIYQGQQAGANAEASNPSQEQDEIFLIVTWAIMLCTIIGPLSVGILGRRMRTLEKKARESGLQRKDVLGVWN